MGTGRLTLPVFPAATGPSPQKSKFFAEVSFGLEFLALFYELTREEQEELTTLLRNLTVAAAQRKLT